MDRLRIAQITGFLGLALIAAGAGLYAVNSAERNLMYGFLASGGALFVLFAALSLDAIRSFTRRRSSRYGANMLATVVLVATILVIVQALSSRHSYRYDLTRNKRFSLADHTLKALATMDDDVDVVAFYQQGDADRFRAEALLDLYAHATDRFRYEIVDPDQQPQRAEELAVSNYGTVVVQRGDKLIYISGLTEQKLTNALLKITSDAVKVVYFVAGHGERDPGSNEPNGFSNARTAMEGENYEVRSLSFPEVPSVPDDCRVLICAGPSVDYFEGEIEKLARYLDAGNHAMFLIDPQVSLPNLEALLAQYRVRLDNDVIIDPHTRMFGRNYTVPVATRYEQHPITRDFKLMTFFPMARSVGPLETPIDGVEVRELAKTGKSAWGELDLEGVSRGTAALDPGDVPAPLTIALAASKQTGAGPERTESRIVVVGDSNFADNSSLGVAGNRDFFLNAMNFLAGEKDLIAIRPTRGLGDRLMLTASQGRLIFLLSVVLLPLAVISVGTTIFVRRRKQG